MTRPFVSVILLAGAAFGQTFEAADVHTAVSATSPYMRGPMRHGVRYELKNASMVDLIGVAYGVDEDKVLGGPAWLGFDRFDVISSVPPGTPAAALPGMLQGLLAERFQLVLRRETKPFPGHALTLGKNPKFKQSDGLAGQNGCQFRAGPGGRGGDDAGMGGPAFSFAINCHNVSMQSFANTMASWVGPSQGNGGSTAVVDKTGLDGTYDLELHFSGDSNGSNDAERAIESQLGLKLEQVTLPFPVIEVDRVNRIPTPNAPDLAKKIPPPPAEFEVASLKASASITPDAGGGGRGGRGGRGNQSYQNDRVNLQGLTLRQLINLAWGLNGLEAIANPPKFLETDRYDVMARAPASVASISNAGGERGPVDVDLYRPMLQKLLTDRFQMKVHFEDRPGDVYVLTAVKPKLQKADPGRRTRWDEGPGPDGKDPRKANPALNRLVYCQNMTMAEFAALLPTVGSGYLARMQVKDRTGLEGRWDFTLNFSGAGFDGGGRGGRGDAPAAAAASEPSGGLSLFDAMGKQLGLKLELQKQPVPVLVIDRMEQKPVEN